jgi:hypothetical protein
VIETASRARGDRPADGVDRLDAASGGLRRPAPGVGYLVAIAVNTALLYVANNLLAWDVLPFLTSEFGQVLWLIDLSLLATIIVNIVFLGFDPAWLKSVCQIALGGISMAVAFRMYQVFPFDFTSSRFDWGWTTRFVMVLTMVGIATGIVVELIKLAGSLVPRTVREGGHNETATRRTQWTRRTQ